MALHVYLGLVVGDEGELLLLARGFLPQLFRVYLGSLTAGRSNAMFTIHDFGLQAPPEFDGRPVIAAARMVDRARPPVTPFLQLHLLAFL